MRAFWRALDGREVSADVVTFVHADSGRRGADGNRGEAIEAGAETYGASCARCHGVAGRGVPEVAPPLDDAAELERRMRASGIQGSLDDFLAGTIADGRAPPSGAYAMAMQGWSAARGGTLDGRDLAGVTAFVRNWHAPPRQAGADAAPQTGTPADEGAALYASLECLGCHGWPGHGGITGPDLAGVGRRVVGQVAGLDAQDSLRVALLTPSVRMAPACPTGPCADMMPRTYGTSLRPGDVERVIRYMLTLADVATEARPSGAPPQVVGALAPTMPTGAPAGQAATRGAELYADHCQACHGEWGQGGMGTAMAALLNGADPYRRGRAATKQGVPGMMPAWSHAQGGPFTAADLDAVAGHLVRLASP
jgi:mono/diheme cytochrome c family protein